MHLYRNVYTYTHTYMHTLTYPSTCKILHLFLDISPLSKCNKCAHVVTIKSGFGRTVNVLLLVKVQRAALLYNGTSMHACNVVILTRQLPIENCILRFAMTCPKSTATTSATTTTMLTKRK